MKRVLFLLVAVCVSVVVSADNGRFKYNGFDGGMMLHAGYINGEITPLGYQANGATKGIGGAIRFHFGNHLRIGTEGYTSTMDLMDNGSYIETFWTGLLTDVYTVKGRFMPYAGVTVGAGAATSFMLFEGDGTDWVAETYTVYNKSGFIAVNPFVGCDYIVSDSFHLTLKMDYLQGFSKSDLYLPTGPRTYLGFIFFH